MPFGKKELPVITLKNLSPPYLEYDYFKGSHSYPFQYEATSFNLINAWWLAEASTLVYAGEEFVRSKFQRAGLPNVKFFNKHGTQCFVAHNDKYAIVAFRGSEIWKKRESLDLDEVMADLETDVDIRLIDWPQGGRVHRGFMEALYEVWPDLFPYISNLGDQGRKIWFTGHSLGGALALLSGGLYNNPQGVYTFGSPWVGNEKFKEQMSVKVYRVINGKDIVSRIPSFGLFVHIGEVKFIDSEGIIRDNMVEEHILFNQSHYDIDGQGRSDKSNNSFEGFIPAPFRDHVPMLYSIQIWNNIVHNLK